MNRFRLAIFMACFVLATGTCADVFRWDNGQTIPGTEGIHTGPGVQLDHRELEFADLAWMNLEGANFAASNLTRANFIGSTLANANLMDAWITGASFSATDLMKEQLYSTASYQQRNLRSITLGSHDYQDYPDYSGWDFSGQDLTEADFRYSNLNDTNFAGANLTRAKLHLSSFTDANLAGAEIERALVGNITAEQLYSTASYQRKSLPGVVFGYSLTNWNFANQNLTGTQFASSTLTNADFRASNLTDSRLDGANLTNANLAGAVIEGADFNRAVGFTKEQLYSTASYQQQDLRRISLGVYYSDPEFQAGDLNLTGWDFSGQNLSGARLSYLTMTNANFAAANLTDAQLYGSTLTNVNFAGAVVEGTAFAESNLTKEQIYSTASYQQKNLHRIELVTLNMTGWDFGGQDLRGAVLADPSVANVNLEGALIREAVLHGITKEQLYSTASYQQKVLHRVSLGGDLTGWDFHEQDLEGANLGYATLVNANFKHANLELAQIHNADLTSANLAGAKLTQANLWFATLTEANLAGANLTSANLYSAALDGADLTGASIEGVSFAAFGPTRLSKEQLYSTASYQLHNLRGISFENNDLAGWDFSRQDLSGGSFYDSNLEGANLAGANLTEANLSLATLRNTNLTGALIEGADFSTWKDDGITRLQLYSTASYQQHNLQRIDLGGVNLTGWDFSGQNLAGAYLYANLTRANLSNANLSGADLSYAKLSNANLAGANLTDTYLDSATFTNASLAGADLRGAYDANTGRAANTANMIHPDGRILELRLNAGQTLDLRDYDGRTDFAPPPINVNQSFFVADQGVLTLTFDADEWDSTVHFAPGIPVTLGGEFELAFADDVNVGDQLGRTFHIFDWTGVKPTGQFQVLSPLTWDFTSLYTTGNVRLVSMPGDFDRDSQLTVADIHRLSETIRLSNQDASLDLTLDGKVDLADHDFWVHQVKRTWLGDANLDNRFDSRDFVDVFLAGQYEDAIEDNSTWATGDWNADGDFTSSDFIVAFQDGGYERGVGMAAASVPEPRCGAMLLLILGWPLFCRARNRETGWMVC